MDYAEDLLPINYSLSKRKLKIPSVSSSAFDHELRLSEPNRKKPYLPPCRICSSPASGFHYGVNTCEACKGFYRRSLNRTSPYICDYNNQCTISLSDRNTCPACRYEKCIEAGMSKAAIKTGRYTHEKRTHDTNEVKGKGNGMDYQPIWSLTAKTDMITSVTEAFKSSFTSSTYMYENRDEMLSFTRSLLSSAKVNRVDRILQYTFPSERSNKQFCMTPNPECMKKSIPLLDSTSTFEQLIQNDNTSLNDSRRLFQVWIQSLNQFVKELVSFSKKLPKFDTIPLDDQIILIKSARGEVTSILRHLNFDAKCQISADYIEENNSLLLVPQKLATTLLPVGIENSNFLYEYSIRSVEKINKLNADIPTLALLACLCLFSPDRDGLSSQARLIVNKLQLQTACVLDYVVRRTYPHDDMMLPKLIMTLVEQREYSELLSQAIHRQTNLEHSPQSYLFEELWMHTNHNRLDGGGGHDSLSSSYSVDSSMSDGNDLVIDG